MNNKHIAMYEKTDTPHIWSIHFVSEESAMYDYMGYIFSDEVGMFSLTVYGTKEAAQEALLKYTEDLNNFNPEDNVL